MSFPIKLILVLVLAQIALLFFLYGEVRSIEEMMPLAVVNTTESISDSERARADLATNGNAAILDESRLRQIIREELAIHLSLNGQKPAVGVPELAYTDENRQQLELVRGKIQYFESVGSISESEMQELQTEIAQLHERDQKQMLSLLIRTLNAGNIEGRL